MVAGLAGALARRAAAPVAVRISDESRLSSSASSRACHVGPQA